MTGCDEYGCRDDDCGAIDEYDGAICRGGCGGIDGCGCDGIDGCGCDGAIDGCDGTICRGGGDDCGAIDEYDGAICRGGCDGCGCIGGCGCGCDGCCERSVGCIGIGCGGRGCGDWGCNCWGCNDCGGGGPAAALLASTTRLASSKMRESIFAVRALGTKGLGCFFSSAASTYFWIRAWASPVMGTVRATGRKSGEAALAASGGDAGADGRPEEGGIVSSAREGIGEEIGSDALDRKRMPAVRVLVASASRERARGMDASVGSSRARARRDASSGALATRWSTGLRQSRTMARTASGKVGATASIEAGGTVLMAMIMLLKLSPWYGKVPVRPSEEDDAAGPEIGAPVEPGASARLLRAHVARRAEDGARGRLAGLGAAVELGDAEVEDLGDRDARDAIAVEEDVLGLDVAVDDARGVRGAERVDHVMHHCQEIADGERRIAGEGVVEGQAREQLHHEVGGVLVVLADVEDVDDARVVDLRGDARLAGEAVARERRGGDVRVHELDRELAAGAEVRRAPHLAHAAEAEPLVDPVFALDYLARLHGRTSIVCPPSPRGQDGQMANQAVRPVFWPLSS